MKRRGETVTSLAAKLGVSRGRANHYVVRASLPRGQVLLLLLALTKLPISDLIPLPQTSAARRRTVAARRLQREERPHG